MNEPFASVIIPTYNRPASLQSVLAHISLQSYPQERYEVIVVDDGSTESPEQIDGQQFAFSLHVIRQDNAGATAARNTGALSSSGDVLVFLDDDIDLAPGALQELVETFQAYPKTILLGLIHPYLSSGSSVFARITAPIYKDGREDPYVVPFSACMTGILCVGREDFFSLGMFVDPTRGWPNWDDVEFGYRAHKNGYELIRNPRAAGWHRDQSRVDLKTSCLRNARAACSAVTLFQNYPDIFQHLPMFHDKTPISIKDDPAKLIVDKLFHAITALGPVTWALEMLTWLAERVAPRPSLLLPLYRWIDSIYIYRGLRQGLRTYGTFF